jgi:hypothetical protein
MSTAEDDTSVNANPNLGPKKSRRVHFSTALVTKLEQAPDYDRTACESDIFSCDLCGIQIPAGMKGFEPYVTCSVCEDGFDACGACCGTEALMRLCHQNIFSPNTTRPTIRSRCHEHILQVVDRKGEILWANDFGELDSSYGKKRERKRSPRGKSKSPLRKKTNLGKTDIKTGRHSI